MAERNKLNYCCIISHLTQTSFIYRFCGGGFLQDGVLLFVLLLLLLFMFVLFTFFRRMCINDQDTVLLDILKTIISKLLKR